jgi:hypothetical protein
MTGLCIAVHHSTREGGMVVLYGPQLRLEDIADRAHGAAGTLPANGHGHGPLPTKALRVMAGHD